MSQAASTPICTCGLIDVHAHCLSPTYKKALAEAGLTSLDGGFPVPEWSAGAAMEVMDQDGIETMILSVSSPSVGFIPDKEARIALARMINEEVAEVMAAHPGRFAVSRRCRCPTSRTALMRYVTRSTNSACTVW